MAEGKAKMQKSKGLNFDQKKYKKMVQKHTPNPPYIRNAITAFVTGGLVCTVGQLFTDFYKLGFGMSQTEAGNPAVATMILLGGLLTGLGVFDKIAKFAGAGVTVPVTGFANSVVSAALEFKKEGLVYGIGSKLFSLAGTVITFGVVTAFVIGLIHAIFVI